MLESKIIHRKVKLFRFYININILKYFPVDSFSADMNVKRHFTRVFLFTVNYFPFQFNWENDNVVLESTIIEAIYPKHTHHLKQYDQQMHNN